MRRPLKVRQSNGRQAGRKSGRVRRAAIRITSEFTKRESEEDQQNRRRADKTRPPTYSACSTWRRSHPTNGRMPPELFVGFLLLGLRWLTSANLRADHFARNYDLHAAILLSAFIRIVACNRVRFAKPRRSYRTGIQSLLN